MVHFFRHMGNFHIPKPLKGKLGIHRVLKTGDLKNSTFGGHFLVARAKNFSRGHHWETVILGRFMLEKITFKVSRVQFDISPWRADSTYLASGLHSLRGIAEWAKVLCIFEPRRREEFESWEFGHTWRSSTYPATYPTYPPQTRNSRPY